MLGGKDMCGRSNNPISWAPDHDGAHSFSEKERRCQTVFDSLQSRYGGFWHLCTPGENQQIIFSTKEEYEAGMQMVAMCALDSPDIGILTFELMSNHFHFVVCGTEKNVIAFFEMLKRRLSRQCKLSERFVDLTNLRPNIIPIDKLDSLRNQIIYTNRNNFLVDDTQTPFSYAYGANSFYFNPSAKKDKDRTYGELNYREKRSMTGSHNIDFPSEIMIIDNYFSPVSYCQIQQGETMFRDARHYFNKLSKDVESMKETARLIGDIVFYTDDELMAVIRNISKKTYGCINPTLLPYEDKLVIAKTIHYDYHASNSKISRMLRIPESTVDALFPLGKKQKH